MVRNKNYAAAAFNFYTLSIEDDVYSLMLCHAAYGSCAGVADCNADNHEDCRQSNQPASKSTKQPTHHATQATNRSN
jgi:hypothetical protein